jgi:8-oxo-dGTP pyrophosphatase MutT (NUDIX family)
VTVDEMYTNNFRSTQVQDNIVFKSLSKKLARFSTATDPCSGGRTPAAVAMILHQDLHDIEILFIQRSAHDMDPWSGHIAFPGGKMEDGELPCQAACRETLEETGIDLIDATYLGRLSDIIGANLPVRVSCCLFAVDRRHLQPTLNEEVRNLFWVPLADLRDPERRALSSVAFDDKVLSVPAIQLPVDNMPVLWGITYRLVMQLLTILEDDSSELEECCRLPETVELD